MKSKFDTLAESILDGTNETVTNKVVPNKPAKQLYVLAIEQGGENHYEVGPIPSLDFPVFKSWEKQGSVYFDEDGNVIVVGHSPEECFRKFEKWDASSEIQTDLKNEGTPRKGIIQWFLSLEDDME